ncbi:terminase TerL endonuclease subunit [uncultured Pelagimonas sp.]|uniref:terminase large subunit n=1 Tax=uncultured Pelagimonas sp. TaxID=1618102 RepID=UPI00260BA988|nr:terminase TerL endonuclease subunit [uncultured Pelagimonas sp.]
MLDCPDFAPITQRGIEWAEDVLSGKIPACKRVKQACKRFKNDLKRAGTDQFPYVFDFEASEHMCAFLETLPHIEGAWAARGETFELIGWQAFLICQIGGWRHMVTGLRRFRTAYIEVARKNGKSTLLAGVGLYFLSVDGEPGAKVYSAAASSDQAREVFDRARVIAQAEMPSGSTLEDEVELSVEQHKIKSADPAAVFRPVASQTKSKDGKNPHCAIIDELHEHEKRDVWDSMESALGAREHPLLIAITTAGYNTAGVCFEQRRMVERILDGVLSNDMYFGLIFEADEGDEPGDPETWAKANPSLGKAKRLDYMEGEWAKAQATPARMGEFLRKHLDIWTSVGAAALDMDMWRAAEDETLRLRDFAGRKAYIGVDLATREDFASVVAIIPDGDRFINFSWHFWPENKVQAPGNEHVWAWAQEGLVLHTPGAELNLNFVEALVFQLAGMSELAGDWVFKDLAKLDVQMVTYDPTYAAQMAANWEGAGIDVVELRQRATNMHVPFEKLISAVEDKRWISDGNPVLRWMAANTLMKKVQGGDFIYPAKLVPEDKIDGISAAITGLWPLSQVEEVDENAANRESYFKRLMEQA